MSSNNEGRRAALSILIVIMLVTALGAFGIVTLMKKQAARSHDAQTPLITEQKAHP